MDRFPPDGFGGDEDHDDLAALDFSAPEFEGDVDTGAVFGDYDPNPFPAESDHDSLAALDHYQPAEADGADGEWAAADPLLVDDEDDEDDASPTFLVTNPPGTVSVAAYLDGRVQRIELAPEVSNLSESQLAAEIVLIARLASEKARSAQRVLLEGVLEAIGAEQSEQADMIRSASGLPTVAEAEAERTEIFSTRYESDHE